MSKTTTIEQGRQLLNAGYLRETADAFWLRHPFFGGEYGLVYASITAWNVFTESVDDCVPAWSLGALWDMSEGESLSFSTQEDRAEGVIATLVKRLVESSDNNTL